MFNGGNNGLKTFTITSQPFYDQYNQCYKNIMMVNLEPQGPLRRLVRRTKLPKLSPYQREGPCNPIPKCGLAIMSLRSGEYTQFHRQICDNSYMTPDEIPDLITFLIGNGYQIETQITNMLNQSDIKLSNKKLAFTVTYYGASQPNITYMR
jgi:hypothetical protein